MWSRVWLSIAMVFTGALALAGCRGKSDAAGTAPSASASVGPLLEPLAGVWRVDLEVTGHGAAVVAVPLGARRPRPVIIALHGDADRPEWQCGTWNGVADRHAFVLCPRGVPRADAPPDAPLFTQGSTAETLREVRAALTALKRRFRDHLSPGPVVLAGTGIGATRAIALLRDEPSFFPRVVLVDGGWESWGSSIADVFAGGGGERVLFVCSTAWCASEAVHQVFRTERAGAGAKLVDATALGHGLDARVAAAVKDVMSWLVAGDPRWAGVYLRSSAPLASSGPAALAWPPASVDGGH